MRGIHLIAGSAALALSGCLVSEAPVLDDSNGRATPLDPGAYIMCPVDEDEDECERFEASHDGGGRYLFTKEDDDPAELRFRRVGREGYLVQSREDDDVYQYYYGKGDSEKFRMTMMLCADLPETLRGRLIGRGDLESDDDDFETCTVKTLKGAVDSAKAYHRGKVESEEEIAIEFTPAPPVEESVEEEE